MKEQALQFGEGRRLIGILARPDRPNPDLPVIVIPTTGVEHRVGPNRLHVHLCRAFADAGFAALRLDLSGMGDSRLPPSGGSADAVADLRQALDELVRVGAGRRFAVVGLCSGAHDAHGLATADERVIAAAFLDGYTYPTLRFRFNYWKQRLFDQRRIVQFMDRKINGDTEDSRNGFRSDQITYFVPPARDQAAADYRAFLQRGLQLFFLYTGEVQNEYNYQDQLLDAFPFLSTDGRVLLNYFPAADHTFSRTRMRSELVGHLVDWMRSRVVPSLS